MGIRNVIRIIYLVLCDTEDWRNGHWKFSFAITGINYILKYTEIENNYFKITNMAVFNAKIVAMVSISGFLQKHFFF